MNVRTLKIFTVNRRESEVCNCNYGTIINEELKTHKEELPA
jgi:hypothetical protein